MEGLWNRKVVLVLVILVKKFAINQGEMEGLWNRKVVLGLVLVLVILVKNLL